MKIGKESEFLEFLDLPKVKNRILEIVFKENDYFKNNVSNNDFMYFSKYTQEIEKDKKEIDSLKKSIINITNEKQKSDEEIEKLNKNIDSLNKEIKDIKNQFRIPLELYKNYCGLPQDIKCSLENLLSDKSPLEFMVKCVQWDNIKGLEDFIIANLDFRKISEENINVLNEIYDGMFFMYSIENKNCKRLNTKVGEEYDIDIHSIGIGSKCVSGKVERVLFDGYVKGNNIRKSIIWTEI